MHGRTTTASTGHRSIDGLGDLADRRQVIENFPARLPHQIWVKRIAQQHIPVPGELPRQLRLAAAPVGNLVPRREQDRGHRLAGNIVGIVHVNG